MTPAERALLLAVAKYTSYIGHRGSAPLAAEALDNLIEAVEAEAAPEAPAEDKSCDTCAIEDALCIWEIEGICDQPDKRKWTPKPNEADVCPTCEGGRIYLKRTQCPDCGGTGKKDKK